MAISFPRWLIDKKIIDYGDLGRLTREWGADTDAARHSRRTNNHSFSQFLGERYPDQYLVYRTYIRLLSNKE
jgi:hypothetical protein